MPESKKYNIRLRDPEETALKTIKLYLGEKSVRTREDITDSEAIQFAIRLAANEIIKEWEKENDIHNNRTI